MDELNAHLSSVEMQERMQGLSVAPPPQAVPRQNDPVQNQDGSAPHPASDADKAALSVVMKYLQDYWPHSAAARALVDEMRKDAARSGADSATTVPELHTLLAAGGFGNASAPAAGSGTSSQSSYQLSLPTLAGPPTIPHEITHTHGALHTNNALCVRSVILPRRQFVTSPHALQGRDPHFCTTLHRVLVSTSSDKQVLFFDSETGEIIESLDPVQRVLDTGHTSPVLDVAQHPSEKREFITVGMDGKVCLWDLLKRKVVSEHKDHTRFIVRCAWDPRGEYLATAGYDKRIVIYRRRGAATDMDTDDNDGDNDDDIEVADLQTQLDPIFTLDTRSNPEAIHFVSASAKTWLVYTLRDDCFMHYVNVDDIVAGAGAAAPEQVSFNTNENPFDTHRSYSILSITSHPTQLGLLSLLTGAHSSTSSTSLILLLPLFSDQRAATIHTNVQTSEHYSPRHIWLPDGSGVYVTSEEGFLRLYDSSGKERCILGVHGIVSSANDAGGAMSAEEKAKRWRMGGMNGSIRDLDILDGGGGSADVRVVTCGFDRTVRVIQRCG